MFKKSQLSWIPDDIRHIWVSNTGRRIYLQDDISICVSSTEDYHLRRLARYSLLNYGLLVQDPDDLPNPGFWGTLFKYCQRADTSILGIGLEKSLKLETKLHKYPVQRINSQYRLHVPYYYISTIRSINKFGLKDDKVMRDEGNPLWVNVMVDQLRRGDTLPYESSNTVHELWAILKVFLKELPGGLLTKELEGLFLLAGGRRMQSRRIDVIQLLIQVLPRPNREALFLLMSLSRQVVISTVQTTADIAAALRRVLFLNDNRPTTDLDIVVIIDAMITKFEDVFNLPAKTLDHIYQQLDKFEPNKLSENIERRIEKRFWESSDIPENLLILNKRHSFETCSFDKFFKFEEASPPTTVKIINDFLNRSANLFRRRQQQDADLHRLTEVVQQKDTYFQRTCSKIDLGQPQVNCIQDNLEKGQSLKASVSYNFERRYTV